MYKRTEVLRKSTLGYMRINAMETGQRPGRSKCITFSVYVDCLQVVQAFKILTSDKQVKAILVNIFGEVTAELPFS